MKFTFHPNAKAEFDNSIDYYENRKSGLGREFADEIYEAIGRILRFPKLILHYLRIVEDAW